MTEQCEEQTMMGEVSFPDEPPVYTVCKDGLADDLTGLIGELIGDGPFDNLDTDWLAERIVARGWRRIEK